MCVLRVEVRGVWARLCVACVHNLNLPQLLPILGTKAKNARENTAVDVSCARSISGLCCTDTASASCISGFCTDASSASILTVVSISSVGNNSVHTASTRSTEILSICSVVLGVSVFRPSVHRVDNSQAQITHRWSDEWELEQITFAGDNSNTLKHWQYFGDMYCEEDVLRVLSASRCSVCFTLSAKKHSFCGNICCMCWILRSRSQSIMSQTSTSRDFFAPTVTPQALD